MIEHIVQQVGIREILKAMYRMPIRSAVDEFALLKGLFGEADALAYYHGMDNSTLLSVLDKCISNLSSVDLSAFNAHLETARHLKKIEQLGIPIDNLKLQDECRKICSIRDDKVGMEYANLSQHIKTTNDGARIYCKWDSYGSVTGRIQSHNPNIQGFPKVVRNTCFCAPKDKILIYADYKSEELVILGVLANDDELLGKIDDGVDLHTQLASKVLKCSPNNISDNIRSIFKHLTFATLYGAGTHTLSNIITEQSEFNNSLDAQLVKNAILDSYPSIRCLRSSILRMGCIEMIDGTTVGLNNIKPHTYVNRLIQSTGSILLKEVLSKLMEKLPSGANVVCLIHDELIIEADVNNTDTCNTIVKSVMQNVLKKFGIDISMPVEIKCKGEQL